MIEREEMKSRLMYPETPVHALSEGQAEWVLGLMEEAGVEWGAVDADLAAWKRGYDQGTEHGRLAAEDRVAAKLARFAREIATGARLDAMESLLRIKRDSPSPGTPEAAWASGYESGRVAGIGEGRLQAQEEESNRAIQQEPAWAQERSPWQPIGTAPKDGTHILLGWFLEGGGGGHPEVAWWSEGRWFGGGRGLRAEGYFSPTHWMPLPAGPQS